MEKLFVDNLDALMPSDFYVLENFTRIFNWPNLFFTVLLVSTFTILNKMLFLFYCSKQEANSLDNSVVVHELEFVM